MEQVSPSSKSAPGAGKSTLLRLFRPSVLSMVHRLGNLPEYRQLRDKLVQLEALSELGPQVLGVLVDCREQYAVIEDLPIECNLRLRWFFGLMDARLTLLMPQIAFEVQRPCLSARLVQDGVRPSGQFCLNAEQRVCHTYGDL